MEHAADEAAEILQFTTEQTTGGSLILAVSGELDLAGAAELEERIRQGIASGGALELDISGLTFIDSTGLSILVRHSLRAKRDGVRFRVREGELAGQVRRLIDTTGTDRVLAQLAAGVGPNHQGRHVVVVGSVVLGGGQYR